MYHFTAEHPSWFVAALQTGPCRAALIDSPTLCSITTASFYLLCLSSTLQFTMGAPRAGDRSFVRYLESRVEVRRSARLQCPAVLCSQFGQ